MGDFTLWCSCAANMFGAKSRHDVRVNRNIYHAIRNQKKTRSSCLNLWSFTMELSTVGGCCWLRCPGGRPTLTPPPFPPLHQVNTTDQTWLSYYSHDTWRVCTSHILFLITFFSPSITAVLGWDLDGFGRLPTIIVFFDGGLLRLCNVYCLPWVTFLPSGSFTPIFLRRIGAQSCTGALAKHSKWEKHINW